MSAALAVITALFGLLAFVLCVPVAVAFRVRGIEPLDGTVAIRWMFGLVRTEARLFQARAPAPRKQRLACAARPADRRRGSGRGGAKVLAVLRQPALRHRIGRLLRDLVRAAHPRQIGLRLRLGLGDPADTGRLWALLWPLDMWFRQSGHAQVRIEPEFMEAALDFEAHGQVQVVPIQLLALAIAFALSPATLRAWRLLADRGGRG